MDLLFFFFLGPIAVVAGLLVLVVAARPDGDGVASASSQAARIFGGCLLLVGIVGSALTVWFIDEWRHASFAF